MRAAGGTVREHSAAQRRTGATPGRRTCPEPGKTGRGTPAPPAPPAAAPRPRTCPRRPAARLRSCALRRPASRSSWGSVPPPPPQTARSALANNTAAAPANEEPAGVWSHLRKACRHNWRPAPFRQRGACGSAAWSSDASTSLEHMHATLSQMLLWLDCVPVHPWTSYICSPSGLCATLAAMADARDVISIYLSLLWLASMVDAQCVAFSTMLGCACRVNPCFNFVVLHNH